jgi:hypothetical protein
MQLLLSDEKEAIPSRQNQEGAIHRFLQAMRMYCRFTGVPCEPVPLDPAV